MADSRQTDDWLEAAHRDLAEWVATHGLNGRRRAGVGQMRHRLNAWFRINGNPRASTTGACSYHAARLLLAYYDDHAEEWTESRPAVDPVSTFREHMKAPGEDTEAMIARLAKTARETHRTSVEPKPDGVVVVTCEGTGVRTLEDLYRLADLSPEDWDPTSIKPNAWTSWMSRDGQPVELQHVQIKATLERRLLAGKPITVEPVKAPRARRAKAAGVSTCLVMPDAQMGFRWSDDRTRLLPLHDRRAQDIGVQLAEMLQPDRIIDLGDRLDFAELSTKYARPMEMRDTLQVTLAECAANLQEISMAAPDSERTWIPGNHEKRLISKLTERAPELVSLRPVGSDSPALSLGALLNLDGIGWDLADEYPRGSVWWEGIEFVHGEIVRTDPGATVAAMLKGRHRSLVQGHVHRVEMASKTVFGEGGDSRVITAATPGCLCDLTPGRVPAASARLNWQQAYLLITVDESGAEHFEMVPVRDGRALFRGEWIVGRDRGDEYAERFGIPALAA